MYANRYNTKATSYCRPEVERLLFCACAMTKMQYNHNYFITECCILTNCYV